MSTPTDVLSALLSMLMMIRSSVYQEIKVKFCAQSTRIGPSRISWRRTYPHAKSNPIRFVFILAGSTYRRHSLQLRYTMARQRTEKITDPEPQRMPHVKVRSYSAKFIRAETRTTPRRRVTWVWKFWQDSRWRINASTLSLGAFIWEWRPISGRAKSLFNTRLALVWPQ